MKYAKHVSIPVLKTLHSIHRQRHIDADSLMRDWFASHDSNYYVLQQLNRFAITCKVLSWIEGIKNMIL